MVYFSNFETFKSQILRINNESDTTIHLEQYINSYSKDYRSLKFSTNENTCLFFDKVDKDNKTLLMLICEFSK